MNVLVIGAAGFLGKELSRDFSENNKILRADINDGSEGVRHLDMLDKEETKDLFFGFEPEVVLLPAAFSAVDAAESGQELVWRINVESVKDIAVLSRKQGAFLVFYSSDYIFDGKAGPYSEEDWPNPLNFYGKTKLEAERIIEKELSRFLIIRTCGIYGYEKGGKNYAMQVLGAVSKGKSFTAVDDQFGTPTYVKDLSRISLGLVMDRKEGIYNVAGPDYVNRLTFAKLIAEIFDLDSGLISGVSTRELKQRAQRPKMGGLKTEKLNMETGQSTLSLKDRLLDMRMEFEADKSR